MKMRSGRMLAGALAGVLLAALAACGDGTANGDSAANSAANSGAAADQNPCAAKANPCAAKSAAQNPCNPCAAKMNPCNPCAAKMNPCNPCAAKNPCGAGAQKKVDASQFMRPAGAKLYTASHAALVKDGEKLWKDPKVGSSGLACQSCHMNNQGFNPTFAQAYAHKVAMPAQMAGADKITLDEMVQFCMLVPMASHTLPWDSKDLAALTAYAGEVQKQYKANPPAATGGMNPCNPCAARNPCGAKMNPCNPCAAKNPCAGK